MTSDRTVGEKLRDACAEATKAFKGLAEVGEELERQYGRCAFCGYIICEHDVVTRLTGR